MPRKSKIKNVVLFLNGIKRLKRRPIIINTRDLNNELPKSFLFAGQMVDLLALNAFAALLLIGCGGGVMPRSTNKIARIPF